MPPSGYETITIRIGEATGWISLSVEVKGKPRKHPVWEMRYRTPRKTSDKTLGRAWVDAELWAKKRQPRLLRSRPASGYLTRDQATEAARACLADQVNSTPEERRTLHEACQAFVAQKTREKVDGSTDYGYRSYARTLCQRRFKTTQKTWGEQPLGAITPADIEHLRNTLIDEGYSVSTLNHYGHMVRGAFGRESAQAKAWVWARDKKKNAERIRFYTPGQIQTLKAAAVLEWERAWYTIAAEAGARRSEILALRRIDVDLAAGVIRLENGFTRTGGMSDTKGHQTRSLPMTRNVARVLAPLVKDRPLYDGEGEPLLVFSRDGRGTWPLDPDSVSKRFARTRKKAGLPRITLHELRHTFGTQAMASGEIDIYTLQRLMGHQEITTTQKYLHFAPRPELSATLSAIWEDDEAEAEVIPLRAAG